MNQSDTQCTMHYQKNLIERAEAVKGSTYALCKETGLDQSNISKIKRGLRPLPLDVLVKICRHCNFNTWEEIYAWVIDQHKELADCIHHEEP